MAAFYLAYFFYGKSKFAQKKYSDERLGSITAYKSLMHLYRPFCLEEKRVRSEVILRCFEHLRQKIDSYSDDGFKTAFLKALAESEQLHHP